MLTAVLVLALTAALASAQRDALVNCDPNDDNAESRCLDFENDFDAAAGGHCFCVTDGELAADAGAGAGACGGGAGKGTFEVEVGFLYNREDRTEDTRGDCGPEVVLSIDNERIASTDADPEPENPAKFPQRGEGEFDVKVELNNGRHCINVQVRDGPGCDVFDDDDDAEDSSSDDRLRQCGASINRKRAVESSSSDDDDDSTLSSSGTTVSLSSLREQQRIDCFLSNAVRISVASSSSSSSDDDDDDEERKRALNYFA